MERSFSSKRFAIAAAGMLGLYGLFIITDSASSLIDWIIDLFFSSRISYYSVPVPNGISILIDCSGSLIFNFNICAALLIVFGLLNIRSRNVCKKLCWLLTAAGGYQIFIVIYAAIALHSWRYDGMFIGIFLIAAAVLLFVRPRTSLAGVGFGLYFAFDLCIYFPSGISALIFCIQLVKEYGGFYRIVSSITSVLFSIIFIAACALAAALCFLLRSEKPKHHRLVQQLFIPALGLFILYDFYFVILMIRQSVQEINNLLGSEIATFYSSYFPFKSRFLCLGAIFAIIAILLRWKEKQAELQPEQLCSCEMQSTEAIEQTDENQPACE